MTPMHRRAGDHRRGRERLCNKEDDHQELVAKRDPIMAGFTYGAAAAIS
jgi:hypothetical protein